MFFSPRPRMVRSAFDGDFQERERALYWGAPMVLVPALALLPAVAFLIVRPQFQHAAVAGYVLLPVFAAIELKGLARLARCLDHPFDIISFVAASAVVVLLVTAIVTGVALVEMLFVRF